MMAEVKQEATNGQNGAVQAVRGSDTEADREWDEAHLEAAQASLKEMYIQLRELRSTIPRLMAPLATKQPTPQKLFTEFSAAAATANAEIKQFRQLMEDEQSRAMFEHVKQSRSQNPKDITPWRITNDPNWAKRKA